MKTEDADFTINTPENWQESAHVGEVVHAEKKKRAGWIEPVVLLGLSIVLWYVRGFIMTQFFKALPVWCWAIMDYACYALALYGVGKLIWWGIHQVGWAASAIALGGLIMFVAWFGSGSIPGVIVGGFVAVIGAVLMVGKR